MQIDKPRPQDCPREKITASLFRACLKCMTKCFLRSQDEARAEHAYADWAMGQIESYRKEAVKRLIAATTQDDCVIDSSGMGNLKALNWQFAVNLVVNAQNLEFSLNAVERIQSQGRGKPTQFIPIGFVISNKITKGDKVLMAFDALVLSKMLGREISPGRIIHGDSHTTLKIITSSLAKEVQKVTQTIEMMISSHSPPDLVLNRHCVECEFHPPMQTEGDRERRT